MLSSTWPFIISTPPLPKGQTYGEPDITPEELEEKKRAKKLSLKSPQGISDTVSSTESESSDGSMNSSRSGHGESRAEAVRLCNEHEKREAADKEKEIAYLKVVDNEKAAADGKAFQEFEASQKKSEEEALVAQKKAEEEALVARKKAEEEAAAARKKAEEEAAAAQKRAKEEEAAVAAAEAAKKIQIIAAYKEKNMAVIKSLTMDLESAILEARPENILAFASQRLRLRLHETEGPSPLVFAGPSGVGKGTIVGVLMKRFPHLFGFSVSHATRAPRPGEENGVHYNFVSVQEMEAAIANGEFIEYAHVHTNYYGSSFKAVETVRNQGKICILDIDIQGVQNIKKSSLDCKYIFIAPPSIEELESRLRGRGTETEEKIRVRMANAAAELAFGEATGNFDRFVVNNDLDDAVEAVLRSLKVWYPKLDFFDREVVEVPGEKEDAEE